MKRQRASRSAAARQRPAKPTGKLRIIGGDFRRRQLPVLDHPGLRPTPDRVRETLFNWLGQALYGEQVLDLFAGSGALGIEALSRGAQAVHFVERDAQVAAVIRDNLATLGTTKGQVSAQDAMTLLAGPAKPASLVFLDPPFHQDLAAPCCAALEANGWLQPEALIYVEVEQSLTLSLPANWQLHRETKAGESSARLYRRMPR